MPIATRGRSASDKLLRDFRGVIYGNCGGGSFDANSQLDDTQPCVYRWSGHLARAKELMDAGRFRRLPVIDNDKLVGIITERDCQLALGLSRLH